MVLSILRLDMRAPEWSTASPAHLYDAALDMAEYADRHGFAMVVLSEHHQTDDGYLPSPLVMAGAVSGRTRNVSVNISALLLNLHDPVRVAEDTAVLDLVSGGRLIITVGLGYRREEYEAAGIDWKRRGAMLDAKIEALLEAWKGKSFTYEGRTRVALPRPRTQPHPPLMVGGSTEAAAKRAVRFGLPFAPAVNDPALAAVYEQHAAAAGAKDGFVLMPGAASMVFVSDDPERMWAELGPHILHDARTYSSWQTEDVRSQVKSESDTLDGIKAEGRYRVMTPEECLAEAQEHGPSAVFIHFPLVGGAAPELGWQSLQLYCEKVLPALS